VKKILFITAHRNNRAPNQRFRFEQYFAFLEQNGFQCTLAPLLINKQEDRKFYQGSFFQKLILSARLLVRRWRDVQRAKKSDVVFIAREAFFLGTTFFENQLRKANTRVIFDFDDAIWIDVISSNNKLFSWLKDGRKTSKIITMADRVFAGNDYLANYAKQFNNSVAIIPTTIDTDVYLPAYKTNKEKVTIGWSGSVSTIEHFEYAIPALLELKKKYPNQIEIKVIGDASYKNEALGIQGLPWNAESEVTDLQTMDIGIMPLPNNEWTWGKCGLKGLQYMALEIPTVMSPVGVNKEIIQHGENGFLASITAEWVSILSTLIENRVLRFTVGQEGRKTVVEKYSVHSQKNRYLEEFNSICSA